MKHPLLQVAVYYVCGILLGSFYSLPLPVLFASVFFLALIAIGVGSRRHWILPLLFLSAGWLNVVTQNSILAPNDLRLLFGEQREEVSVHGRIVQTPVYHTSQRRGQETWRTTTELAVKNIARGTNWQSASGNIKVRIYGLLDASFQEGQDVQVKGLLHRPRSRAAEGLFDYRSFLEYQNIYFQLTVLSTNDWIAVTDAQSSRSLTSSFYRWAQACMAKDLAGEDASLRLLWAMVLGWKTGLAGNVSEPFVRSGTMHVFAISGLHIALIAGILVSVCRVLQLPRSACGWVIIPLLWFYTIATGWQPSAVRSTIMMSVILIGWSLKRPSNPINSLAAAALIILIWNPNQLYQPGFQLSFMVVLVMALFVPPLNAFCRKYTQPDPMLPMQILSPWQREVRNASFHVLNSLSVSLVAWLGSLPLIAYYFYMITPVSLLANLIVVPLSSIALISSMGSLACGDWFPWIRDLFNHSSWFLMECMVQVSNWSALVPSAYFYVPQPTIEQVGAFYAGLGLFAGKELLSVRGKQMIAVIFAGLLAFIGWNWLSQSKTTSLTVLPLGGSGILVDAPGSDGDLLIDCGDKDAVTFTITDLLHSRGFNQLPNLLLTHGDARHVDGFELIDTEFSAGKIFTSSAISQSESYRRIIGRLEAEPNRWKTLNRGDEVCGWIVLHPDRTDRFMYADDNAVVLYRNLFGTRVLMISDLGQAAQKTLVKREPKLKADILIVGVPGQGAPISPELLLAVDPELIIVADAAFPFHARAGQIFRESLIGLNAKVLYTSDTGAVTLSIKPNSWSMRSTEDVRILSSTR